MVVDDVLGAPQDASTRPSTAEGQRGEGSGGAKKKRSKRRNRGKGATKKEPESNSPLGGVRKSVRLLHKFLSGVNLGANANVPPAPEKASTSAVLALDESLDAGASSKVSGKATKVRTGLNELWVGVGVDPRHKGSVLQALSKPRPLWTRSIWRLARGRALRTRASPRITPSGRVRWWGQPFR